GWQSQKKFIFHKDVDSSIFKGSRALLADRLKRNRRIWIQVSGGDENIQRERENEVIMDLLGILHRDSIAIGVVMPFRKQIQRLRNSLEREYARKDLPIPDSIRIDTVERFQGGQRDVVIIAAGICDASTIEILQSIMPADPQIDEPEVDCKLNVALTRAREQVIVVGNPAALCCSPHYGALYDSIGEKLEYEFSGGSGRYAEPTGW
ncbi:MAG: C-terminal helicase domain-containing protein, partial [Spirochaetota bacterium]|nr:C-terminal helicase domain-containing protein [Spirochaetota bacterium]